MRIKTLMLAVSAIALGTVSPAAAEEPTTTTTQPTTCVSTCGQWGSIIGADIAGATFGEGLAGAKTASMRVLIRMSILLFFMMKTYQPNHSADFVAPLKRDNRNGE
jgi:hypothetical protein